jgi:hypothetical protein
MTYLKPVRLAAIVLGSIPALYGIHSDLEYFSNISYLGGVLSVKWLIAAPWKFEQRFLVPLLITFLRAAMNVPRVVRPFQARLSGFGTVGPNPVVHHR